MRGLKAKAIRRQAKLMMNGKTITETQYEVTTHPAKFRMSVRQNPETQEMEPVKVPYNPRQLRVKSRFDVIVRALKARYKIEMRSGNSMQLIKTA